MKKNISIAGFFILTLAIVNCKNSNDSNSTQSNQIDLETITELTEKKLISKDSIHKASFNLPQGYKLFDQIQGDLNGDGLEDYVLITKETNKENIVSNRFNKKVDRNRRGILIYLTKKDTTFLAIKNLNCFLSENEDGGVYFPPALSITIEKGKLFVHYHHGRYGYWKYTFRYEGTYFELIGYDSSENYGPIVNRETSINFLTNKMLTRKNINQSTEESGDEIFENTWKDLDIQKLYRLSEIIDFEELHLDKETY